MYAVASKSEAGPGQLAIIYRSQRFPFLFFFAKTTVSISNAGNGSIQQCFSTGRINVVSGT
jgi:UDP:flavonoid glycosyltransferase YjiC (YdhE family)